jgi:16S rRNA (cytosine967-C5)-methyltransferase
LLSSFAKGPLKTEIRYLLWMSLYQVLYMRKGVHHVVSEAVEYAKIQRGQPTANFVNAVLRRAIREKDQVALPADPLSELAIRYSFPHWLINRWSERFGIDDLHALLTKLNEPPDFTLRIDLNRVSRQTIVDDLNKRGIAVKDGHYLASALTVDRIGPVLESTLFAQKLIHVQDETSQLAGYAVSLEKPQIALDACAGQGTKTDQLRQLLPDTTIVAMDLDGRKLSRIQGANSIVKGDVLKSPFAEKTFDCILLDAPCSSLGIIRKHPEVRWRRNEKDLFQYGRIQKNMIKSLSTSLKSGGSLIYSVCSFEPEETIEVIEQASKDGQFSIEPPFPDLMKDRYLLSIPHRTSMDGFFIARLIKK